MREENERNMKAAVDREVEELSKKYTLEKRELERIITSLKADLAASEDRHLLFEGEKQKIIAVERSNYEGQVASLKSDLRLVEERLMQAESERDRLDMRARSEIENLRLQLSDREYQYEQEISLLRREIEWGVGRKINDERLFLEEEIAKYKKVILDLESRINMLKTENEKLYNDNHRMHGDIEHFRVHSIELENSIKI